MKKQIIFYIIWDVLFIIFVYAYSILSRSVEHSFYRWATQLFFLAQIILPLIIGIFFSCLVLVSTRYDFTLKLAVIELVFVGGLSLYLATTLVLPAFISNMTGGSAPRFLTLWWMTDITVPMTVGSILLGYELVMFIARMNRCRKVNQTDESNQA